MPAKRPIVTFMGQKIIAKTFFFHIDLSVLIGLKIIA